MIFLDTHAFVWLYAGLLEKFPVKARTVMDEEDLKISPIVMLETQYLYEINRITHPAQKIYEDLHLRLGLTIDGVDWISIVQNAIDVTWTRDPFDRLIVAHAQTLHAPLLSADQTILKHYPAAIWME